MSTRFSNTVFRMTVTALFLAAGSHARADMVTFDTTPDWNGSTSISAWGSVQSGATATYGQTFLVPANASVLNDFTFYINGFGSGGTVTFQADVFAWSGSLLGGGGGGATGPALFSLSGLTLTDNGSFQAVTINTGGTALTPGGQYVALLTTSDPQSIAANGGANGFFGWGLTDNYSHVANSGGGGFVYYNNTTDSQLNTTPWGNSDFGDLAWTANFSSPAGGGSVNTAPEPTSLAMLGIAAIGMALRGYRRRRVSGPSVI